MQSGRVVAVNVKGIWQLGSVAAVTENPVGLEVVFVKDAIPLKVVKDDPMTPVHKVRDSKLEALVAEYTGVQTPQQKYAETAGTLAEESFGGDTLEEEEDEEEEDEDNDL